MGRSDVTPRAAKFEDHSLWACAHRAVLGHGCQTDLACRCACHDASYAATLQSRGFHVHRWKGRILEAVGLTPKVAIWCRTCPMLPPPSAHPDILRP